jgi:hypothetical protein
MKTNTEAELLKEHIIHLEFKQTIELRQLKSQVHRALNHLNPLASFFGNNAATEMKTDLVGSAINITSQFLFRNTLLGRFQNPVRRIIGNWLQHFINR